VALRVYVDNNLNTRNAVHLFYRVAICMSNPFDEFSPEILAGWFSRKSSKELWLEEMEDLWNCTASDGIACKTCKHFDEDCQAGDAQECPQVIAEFNLDDRHFN
tara:strand:+ start:132 stop:443 length:312 start_codon:yes stop_codon:yes gene_type:complete